MRMPDKEPVREHYGVEIPEQDRAPIRFFEGIRFRLRDKGAGAGDSTVLRRLQELQTDVASPNGGFFDAHAEEFVRCFQPVKGTLPVDTKEVPTLLDQLAPALKEFTPQQRRETLQYLVHDLSQSLVHNKQPRSEKTGRSDINERTRDTAKFVGTTLEEKILERMDPTPIPGKTDFDRFMRIPVRTGQAFGAIFLALKLGGCTPIHPTITPETIRPAITQPAQITENPTITPEPIPSATPSGPETTPIALENPIVMLSEIRTPEGCDVNTMQLDALDFQDQLQRFLAAGNAETANQNVILHSLGAFPGSMGDVYHLHPLLYQSLDNQTALPFDTCGQLTFEDETARLFHFFIPFPTANGGTEMIPIVMATQYDAHAQFAAIGGGNVYAGSEEIIFTALKHNATFVRLSFFFNAHPQHEENPQNTQARQQWIDTYGFHLTQQLFDENEANRFSELFIRVFWQGSRDPAVLAELKTLMGTTILPGFIQVEER